VCGAIVLPGASGVTYPSSISATSRRRYSLDLQKCLTSRAKVGSGAKPETDEHSHDLPLSADSGRFLPCSYANLRLQSPRRNGYLNPRTPARSIACCIKPEAFACSTNSLTYESRPAWPLGTATPAKAAWKRSAKHESLEVGLKIEPRLDGVRPGHRPCRPAGDRSPPVSYPPPAIRHF